MKRTVSLAAFVAVALTMAQGMAADAPVVLKDKKDKISYSIGVQIGASVKQQTLQQQVDVKPEMVAAGLKDALTGAKMQLTDDQVRETLSTLQQEVMDRQSQLADQNKKDGEKFLAQNKTKPGVKALPSGLQYQVLKEGKGQKPKASDTVKANYKGTLINGTEFDNSEKHGGAASFNLSGVIPGWTEALQLMPVGSKWRLFIPSDLAYREQGAGGVIGPNSTLVFDVELLAIENEADPLK
ncbi:MAG: FKBP-type peptidyl-prolyl cis-trans isomerase [Verrucomicrobiota bacterium]